MVRAENILITGSNGQLGQSLLELSSDFKHYNFFFNSRKDLDITDFKRVEDYIEKQKISTIINCAAYTNVMKAEDELFLANLINNLSVENLANLCYEKSIKLIHISTDYVFDGKKSDPYNENDMTNPLNNYGLTKCKGEEKILKLDLKNSLIIRTSWLYSKSENNFVSKIIKKIHLNESFGVTNREFGSPTRSSDLAKAILSTIPKIKNNKVKIYHFSNLGNCSRFEFANEINKLLNKKNFIKPTFMINDNIARPKNSSLDPQNFSSDFGIKINPWKDSLKNHITNLKMLINEKL